ncbi:hypothetical protein [Caulobacter sp. NIBR2454]|uniref:hypothetical protein n=1 Tax=Caulobacter sp. NIBR2454 TaxID=3015996 RepID=UPI0022B73A4D|nr:hypothetical protein [Caulobacter sp. NIBR2454]
MPESSESDRRKAAALPDWFAKARLVQALEYRWEIYLRCQFCGATKTWRRDIMLGRLRKSLNMTFAEIQRRARCERCQGAMPIMGTSGPQEPGSCADVWRREVIEVLLDAGLSPADYGYGWRPQAHVR